MPVAIGKAAKWMPFATAQQTPASSSSVDHDTVHPTVSIADEKQFGFENVRLPSPPLFDLRLSVLSSP
jgi:hypothetical protein